MNMIEKIKRILLFPDWKNIFTGLGMIISLYGTFFIVFCGLYNLFIYFGFDINLSIMGMFIIGFLLCTLIFPKIIWFWDKVLDKWTNRYRNK